MDQYKALLQIIQDSKEDLTKNAGYEEIVIEDFHEALLGAVQKLEKLPKEWEEATNIDAASTPAYPLYVQNHLMSVLCNHEEAQYIIMYARFLAAAHLKKNAILF